MIKILLRKILFININITKNTKKYNIKRKIYILNLYKKLKYVKNIANIAIAKKPYNI